MLIMGQGKIIRWDLSVCSAAREYQGHTAGITSLLITSVPLQEEQVLILISSSAGALPSCVQ
jgi:hypothetical protein